MATKTSIWNYLKRYHSNSIFFGNLILILVFVAVPLIFLSLFTYNYNLKILDEEVQKANTRALFKFQIFMDNIQKEVKRISAKIITDKDVLRFVNIKLKKYPDYNQIKLLRSIIDSINRMINNYIFSIQIYSNFNDYVVTSVGGGDRRKWNQFPIHPKGKFKRWYFDYYDLYRSELSEKTYRILSHHQEILSSTSDEQIGIAMILLDIDKILSLSGTEKTQREVMFTVDKDGIILFSTELDLINSSVYEIFNKTEADLFVQSGIHSLKYNEKPYVFSFVRSERNSWIYCSILSQSEYFSKQIILKNILVVSLIVSLFISIGTALVISLYVYKPIHEVIGMLEKPASIHDYGYKNSELDFIAANIMHNYDEFLHNREEIQDKAHRLNTARIRALQAQINPHFLNNTIQLVNWVILSETGNEDSQAIKILEDLGNLVRVNMETQNNTVSLKEEVMYAARYMSIQKKRYVDKINYEESFPEDLMDTPVLKMLIQPLLENAIYHGLQKIDTPGFISLKARRKEHNLILTVEDNGKGMDILELQKLNEKMQFSDSTGNKHIGLTNIALRLRLVFGNQAGIYLSHRDGHGMLVTVSIPLQS